MVISYNIHQDPPTAEDLVAAKEYMTRFFRGIFVFGLLLLLFPWQEIISLGFAVVITIIGFILTALTIAPSLAPDKRRTSFRP